MSEETQIKFEEHKRHFPSDIGQYILDYVSNSLLLHSRYIFTRKSVSGKHACHCTHCKENYLSDTLKHNSEAKCPKCGSQCTVKAAGRGRKYLIDQAYFVYYEKSLINPQAIVARGYYVKRDYSGDYTSVKTIYDCRAMYLFEPGNSQRYSPMYWSPKKWGKYGVHSIFGEFTPWAKVDCPYDSIVKAVEGTPFQYSTWEHYRDNDMVKFFEVYSKYPCVEYLTKMGMGCFVRAKMYGGKTYGAINWRGKRITEVLKLSKQQLNEIKKIKETGLKLHPLTLRLQQIVGKEKSYVPLHELQVIAEKYDDAFEDIKRIIKYTTLRRAIAYIEKQWSKDEIRKQHYNIGRVFSSWRDYIGECEKLEMDLSLEKILFPKDLMESHRKTSALVEHKHDELMNANIKKRAKALKKWEFESDNLFIRPAGSVEEIVKEGNVLQHCVGGYAERHAKGSTNILFIRKKSEPNKPFFTMEVKGTTIIQTQGMKHVSPSGEVEEFVELFKSERLKKRSNKSNQEVAV